jgi:hypothetical protein
VLVDLAAPFAHTVDAVKTHLRGGIAADPAITSCCRRCSRSPSCANAQVQALAGADPSFLTIPKPVPVKMAGASYELAVRAAGELCNEDVHGVDGRADRDESPSETGPSPCGIRG